MREEQKNVANGVELLHAATTKDIQPTKVIIGHEYLSKASKLLFFLKDIPYSCMHSVSCIELGLLLSG